MAKPLPFSSGGGAIASLPANSWPRRRTMLLLFLAIMIVAADKSVFAFAGVRIMDDLQLSPTVFGGLGSAFFCAVSGGRRGLRFSGKPGGSALDFARPGADLGRLPAGRGLGAYGDRAVYLSLAARHRRRPVHRADPACLLQVVCAAGTRVTCRRDQYRLDGGDLAVCRYLAVVDQPSRLAHRLCRAGGFEPGMGLLWLWLGREGQVAEAAQHLVIDTEMDAQPLRHAYRHLLLNRSFIGVTVLGFVGYLLSGLGFSWNPVWMQKGLGYSAQQTGVRVMLIMLLVIGWMLAVSWWSQRLLKRGASQRLTLVGLPVGCCVIGGVALALLGLHLPLGALGKLVLAGVAW